VDYFHLAELQQINLRNHRLVQLLLQQLLIQLLLLVTVLLLLQVLHLAVRLQVPLEAVNHLGVVQELQTIQTQEHLLLVPPIHKIKQQSRQLLQLLPHFHLVGRLQLQHNSHQQLLVVVMECFHLVAALHHRKQQATARPPLHHFHSVVVLRVANLQLLPLPEAPFHSVQLPRNPLQQRQDLILASRPQDKVNSRLLEVVVCLTLAVLQLRLRQRLAQHPRQLLELHHLLVLHLKQLSPLLLEPHKQPLLDRHQLDKLREVAACLV